MQLEKQVCSLKLAKQLKELGFKQESLYFWYKDHTEKKFNLGSRPPGFYLGNVWQGYRDRQPIEKIFGKDTFNKPAPIYSAYTVAELGDIMKEVDADLPYFANGYWWAYGMSKNDPDIKAKTEADARAKLLIYLKENKLI